MKNLFILIAIAGSLVAQNTGQNVVNQTVVASNSRTADFTLTSSAVQNIGQSNHTMVINITANTLDDNAVTASCSIQGSINGTTWQDIGNVTTFPITGLSSLIGQIKCYGYGSYPYIRTSMSMTRINTGSITFSGTYLGTSIPVNSLIDYGANISPLLYGTNTPLVKSGVLTTLFTAPVYQSINVYGMSISSDATGTVLVFACSGTTVLQLDSIGTQRFINFPAGLRPFISCPLGRTLTYTLTGTPTVTLNVAYRLE